MSIEVSKFYWDQCVDVRGSARLVILALADYCNEAGWCFPSVPELARRCRLSDRGTQKILVQLAAGGHIAVTADGGTRKTGGSPTHKYHLLAYQHSLSGHSLSGHSFTGAQGEQMAHQGELTGSPCAAGKGEQMRSPCAADEGEQTAHQGEQIDAQGEPASSPDPYGSTNDPNTNSAARAAAGADYQKVVKAYHNEIGTLTPIVEAEIKAELAASSAEWVIRAIGIAAMRGKRRWAYVAGILRRWHADGFDGEMDKPGSNSGSSPGSKTSSKSMGYGRQGAPTPRAKRQSIEDYADDPEYYEQLKALYAGGNAAAVVASGAASGVAAGAAAE